MNMGLKKESGVWLSVARAILFLVRLLLPRLFPLPPECRKLKRPAHFIPILSALLQETSARRHAAFPLNLLGTWQSHLN